MVGYPIGTARVNREEREIRYAQLGISWSAASTWSPVRSGHLSSADGSSRSRMWL